MKLKDLVKKLAAKPNQSADVDFIVYESKDGNIVCCGLNGPATTDIMRVLEKHAPKPSSTTP